MNPIRQFLSILISQFLPTTIIQFLVTSIFGDFNAPIFSDLHFPNFVNLDIPIFNDLNFSILSVLNFHILYIPRLNSQILNNLIIRFSMFSIFQFLTLYQFSNCTRLVFTVLQSFQFSKFQFNFQLTIFLNSQFFIPMILFLIHPKFQTHSVSKL